MEILLQHSNPAWVEFPIKSKTYLVFVPCSKLLECVEINNPDIQRELNDEWIQTLKNKIDYRYQTTGIYDFGRIDIAMLHDKLFILNGQHRYAILKNDPKYEKVDIEIKIYCCLYENELNELFMVVNGSRPSIMFESTSHQLVLNKIRKYFQYKYAPYISLSKKPHKPNINLDNIIEYILENNILHNMSYDEFINRLEKLNSMYLYSSLSQWKKWKTKNYEMLLSKCRDKSPLNVFVLGVFPHTYWLNILNHRVDDVPLYSVGASTQKKSINRHLRRQVWKKRNHNNIVGNCYVCNNELDYDSFECGHITSWYHGGGSTLDNLEPICRFCNNDMGVQNLLEYKRDMVVK